VPKILSLIRESEKNAPNVDFMAHPLDDSEDSKPGARDIPIVRF